ncbi:hypothetical protein QCA50_015183 [Cerrena zonata]|uniref:Uncharacterized protein n=1 Tax=Cerrena zonata TaxID=2478898 RepID=A0AAW0FM21_9APHY
MFEAFVLGLTLFKTLGIKRQAAAAGVHTSLTNLLVHDGSLQFGLICVMSILDIILLGTMRGMVTTIPIKSIILNHLAFHLRQVYHAEEPTDVQHSSGSVRFQSFIVGNAGAPLHSVLMDSHEDIEVEESSI